MGVLTYDKRLRGRSISAGDAMARSAGSRPDSLHGASPFSRFVKRTTPLSDLDQLGFLSVPGGRDKEGRQVVMVAAKNYPARVLKTDRVFRYFAHTLDALVDEPYVVVWLHTGSSYWNNCPSLAWLWRTYERLPCKYRTNLARLFVVHCDLPLWGALATLGPLLSADFWRKVEWVSRVEFLWDHIPKKQLLSALPAYVAEHDALLEDQPLMDYGVVASKEVNNVPGLPAPPM